MISAFAPLFLKLARELLQPLFAPRGQDQVVAVVREPLREDAADAG